MTNSNRSQTLNYHGTLVRTELDCECNLDTAGTDPVRGLNWVVDLEM